MTDCDDETATALRSLVESGLSASEALDYYFVEECDHTQTEWAEIRGTRQPSVSENVTKAKKKLGED